MFVAYFAGLILQVGLAFGLVIVSLLGHRELLSQKDKVQEIIERETLSFPMLCASMIGSELLLLSLTLLGAWLSPVAWRQRLRLLPWPGGLPVAGLVAAACVSLSAVEGWLIQVLRPGSDWSWARMARVLHAMPPPQLLVMAGLSGLAAPLAEELFFRGYIQTRLRERWGPWPAVLVTAVLFGVFHLDPTHAVFAAILGVLLGWAAEATGSLWPSIIAHVCNNLVAVLSARLLDPSPGGFSPALLGQIAAACVTCAACVALTRRRLRGP